MSKNNFDFLWDRALGLNPELPAKEPKKPQNDLEGWESKAHVYRVQSGGLSNFGTIINHGIIVIGNDAAPYLDRSENTNYLNI